MIFKTSGASIASINPMERTLHTNPPSAGSQPAPTAAPGIQAVTVVSMHAPKVSLVANIVGGIAIKLDDFTFVQVNYDHRYTDNRHRLEVASAIGRMLGWDDSKQVEQEPIPSGADACAVVLSDARCDAIIANLLPDFDPEINASDVPVLRGLVRDGFRLNGRAA